MLECPLWELCPLLSKAAVCLAGGRETIYSQDLGPSHSRCGAQKLREREKANSVIRKCVRGTHHCNRSAMEYHLALTKTVAYHPRFTDGNTKAQRSYLASPRPQSLLMSPMEELSPDHFDFRLRDPCPAFTALLSDPTPVTINCGVEEVAIVSPLAT